MYIKMNLKDNANEVNIYIYILGLTLDCNNK